MPFTEEDYEEALAHFGVKGMHWGVRRDRTTGGAQRERTPEEQKLHNQKLTTAALVLASTYAAQRTLGPRAAAVTLLAGGTYYVAKYRSLPASSFSDAEKAAGKSFSEGVPKHQGKT